MKRLFLLLGLALASAVHAEETLCPLTPDLQCPIAPEMRTYNQTGVQCVWCSLSTLAKYQGIAAACALTDRYKGQSDEGQVRRVLDSLGIRYRMQSAGRKDPRILQEACSRRWGACVGLRGQHMINVVHYAEGVVKVIDNSDRTLAIRTLSERDFLALWDGWAVVLIPPCGE